MADALETYIEQNKIIEVITRLFVGTDNRDWAQVKDCFTGSVWFDMSSMGAGDPGYLSPDNIVAMWDKGLKPLKAIHHQAGNYLVTVNGTKAEAFCYATASHYLPNKTNNNTRMFVGSYNFELEKGGDGWRIFKFKFNLKYVEGNQNLENS